jgi:Spy/CpxP family protein refolding chaperone
MKNMWMYAGLLATVLAIAPAAPLLAYEKGAGMQGHGGGNGWQKHMQEKLGLTDDQVAKLQAIKDAREKAMKPLRRKQRDLMIKLHDQLEDKASDQEIKATLASLRSNRDAIREEAKRFRGQMEALLTPTQQAKMMLGRMHRRGGWGHDEHRERLEHHPRAGEPMASAGPAEEGTEESQP